MRTDRYRPNPPPYLLYGILGLSLVMNLFMVLHDGSGGADAPPAGATPAEEPSDAEVTEAPPAPPEAVAVAEAEVDADAAQAASADLSQWQVVHAEVRHSLARTFHKAAPDAQADAVAAVFSRVAMWDLDLRRDVQAGDTVTALWRLDASGELHMPVVWYESQARGTTLKAYAWQAPGDAFASYWTADGAEVPRRLKSPVLDDYQQITALLRDRPDHRGMDFKTPVGTPVKAGRGATVVRTNWNTAANGGCVELRYADGTLAKFLHLSEVKVKPGEHVQAGQVVALSGNTGHSTAPHLHYQLDNGHKTLDPLEYHGTVRRQVSEPALPALHAEIARLDALLAPSLASR